MIFDWSTDIEHIKMEWKIDSNDKWVDIAPTQVINNIIQYIDTRTSTSGQDQKQKQKIQWFFTMVRLTTMKTMTKMVLLMRWSEVEKEEKVLFSFWIKWQNNSIVFLSVTLVRSSVCSAIIAELYARPFFCARIDWQTLHKSPARHNIERYTLRFYL